MYELKIEHLKVLEYGTGEKLLILIHGGPGLGGYLDSLGALLKDKFRIVEYFQRDTPASFLQNPVSIRDHIKDLKLIVEHYKKENPILVGHSWGATLALAYAGTYPGNTVFALSTGALNEETRTKFVAELTKRYPGDEEADYKKFDAELSKIESIEDKSEYFLENWLKDYGKIYNRDPESVVLNIKSFSLGLRNTYDDLSIWERDNLFIERMKDIKDKVVAIHGAYDPLPHKEILGLIRENVKDAKIILNKDGGHFLWLDTESKDGYIKTLISELESA